MARKRLDKTGGFGVEVQVRMEDQRVYLNITKCLGELKHLSRDGRGFQCSRGRWGAPRLGKPKFF